MKYAKLFLLASLLHCIVLMSAQDAELSRAMKELEKAETRMFENVKYSRAQEYFKTDVSDDFFTINADGVAANKQETLADTARLQLFEMATIKVLDRKIRVYGDVGITNGRAQAFVGEMMVAEFLYTTIFVKRNDKWMYTGWQGTMSKDSPRVPPAPQE